MSAETDQMVSDIAAIKDVEVSAKAALDAIFAKLQTAVTTGDLAQVQAALDEAKAAKEALAAAIATDQ